MPPFASAGAVAVGQLQQLPFKNIIGGPLVAAIEAQAKAAQTTVDFIQAVGFEDVNGELNAVNLTFSYEDSTGAYRRVIVPLLSVIPIPFIVIDTVDIQFKARISASASASSSTSTETNSSVSATARLRFWGQSLDITGSYSSKKDSKASQESKYSVEYTMDVHVHASQAGVPQGMAQILNILQDGISNRPKNAQITVISFDKAIANDSAGAFQVLVLDADGEAVASGVTVSITSQSGLIKPATGTQTATPGIYKVNLTPGDDAPNLTDDTQESVYLTIDTGDETINETRLIVVQRPAPSDDDDDDDDEDDDG